MSLKARATNLSRMLSGVVLVAMSYPVLSVGAMDVNSSGKSDRGASSIQARDWSATPSPSAGGRDTIHVFLWHDELLEADEFQSLGYAVTVGEDLSFSVIVNYDVVIISEGFNLASYRDDITQYVNGGGGLWIHQPGLPSFTIDYAPPGFEAYITTDWWCGEFWSIYGPHANQIVAPSHPTMLGLETGAVDWRLPGRYDMILDTDLGPGYSTITARGIDDGVDDCTNNIHSAAGCFGSGSVFLDCSNLDGLQDARELYVHNVLQWLAANDCGPIATERATWGTTKRIFE